MSTIKVKILDNQDEKAWNHFVDLSPWGDILQMWQWGELKKTQGWKPLRIGVIRDGLLILAIQILLKPVPFLGNYAHAPHGPVFHNKQDLEIALPYLVEFLMHISRTYDFAVVEIEPKIGKLVDDLTSEQLQNNPNLAHFCDPEIITIFEKNKFKITGRNVEPIHKLYYDLSQDETTLLSHCQKNTRYNIKLAQKKGVVVTEYLPDNPNIKDKLSEFFELVKITQDRAKGYPVRDLKTYQQLFELFKGTDHISLFEASFEGQTIVMNISQRNKFWSSSFYAGSNRLFTSVKAPYLLRWKSIQRAKNSGSKSYDFWGIVPSGKHAGYSDHKLSFGGIRIDNYGLLALPINPIKYELWDFAIWIRTEGKSKTREFLFETKDKTSNFIIQKYTQTKNWIQKILNSEQSENTTQVDSKKDQKNSDDLKQNLDSNSVTDSLESTTNLEVLQLTTLENDSKTPLALVEITAEITDTSKPELKELNTSKSNTKHEKNLE